MHASKEEARKANANLKKTASLLDECQAGLRDEIKKCLIHVQNFVAAAERKLPNEASFKKDKDPYPTITI